MVDSLLIENHAIILKTEAKDKTNQITSVVLCLMNGKNIKCFYHLLTTDYIFRVVHLNLFKYLIPIFEKNERNYSEMQIKRDSKISLYNA